MDDKNLNTSAPSSPSPDIAELNKRRALIKSLYQEVLGRDADINGLSYYTVHKEISEDDIRKQMTQSTDHRDILIKAQRYPELEKKCIEMEDQVIRLQNANNEKDHLIENLRAVTSNMKNNNQAQGNGAYAYDLMQNPNPQQEYRQQNQQQGGGMNVTNLKFPKNNKGCMGIIRNILGI